VAKRCFLLFDKDNDSLLFFLAGGVAILKDKKQD
jgi:hypothetical protein